MTDQPKRLTPEELAEIRLRLNGSNAGPWAPDYVFAKEAGGRYWANRLLGHCAALEQELAEARVNFKSCETVFKATQERRERDRAEVERLKAERDSARAQAARLREVLKAIASNEYMENGACFAWKKAGEALKAEDGKS